MDLNLSIANIIIFLTSIISIGFAFFLVSKKSSLSNWLLFSILMINGLLSLNIFIADSGILSQNLNLLFLPLIFVLGLGPSIYFYTESLISKNFKLKTQYLLFYLPVAIQFIFYVLLFYYPTELKIEFSNLYFSSIISPLEQALGIVFTVLFLFLSLQKLVRYENWLNDNFSNKEVLTLNWLKRLLIIYSVIWLIWIIVSALDFFLYNWTLPNSFYYPVYMLISLLTITVVVTALRKKHSVIFEEGKDVIKTNTQEQKKDINILDSENLELIYKLRQLMEVDQLYLDSTLKMAVLAEQLNIPSHKLSCLLNSGLKKSFYEFINFYRVEHVKKMLLDEKNAKLTILAIAYDSGFNSKSTFNEIFKKVTEMTPKEFKKQAFIGE